MIHVKLRGVDGRTFNVVLVQKGEHYGDGGTLVHDRNDPLVEFWDDSADRTRFPANGQFVTSYYMSTLFAFFRHGAGLDLCGYEPAWKLDAHNMLALRVALESWCRKAGYDPRVQSRPLA